jgi:flagellar hook-length control protein FliK
MVQSATAIAAKTAESHRSSAPKQGPDNDFMSVLQNVRTVKQPAESREHTPEATLPDDQKPVNKADENSNVKASQDTAASDLAKIVDNMMVVAQQIINNPKPKDVSAMMEAFLGKNTGGQPSEGLSSIFAGQDGASQTTDSGIEALFQNNGGQASNYKFALLTQQNDGKQGENPANLLDRFAANAANAATRTGNINENPKMSQDSSAEGALKLDADAQAALGKTGAALARSVDTFDETLTQLKVGALEGKAVEMKDAGSSSAFYSQSVQSQDLSTQSARAAQETIPVHRISAVDEVISKAAAAGQKDIVIRIDPPDLGSVHIRLSLDNGVLKADVRVDSAAAKDSFLAAMPQIRTALENAGIKASEFNVDVRDDQQEKGQSGNNNAKQQQRQDGEARNAFSDFFA